MILPKELTEEDVGRWVEYRDHGKSEKGRIKSWSEKWIFVVYACANNWNDYQNYTGCATNPRDLVFFED